MSSSQHDTIVAIATPPGQGGIGIVRLAGPRARDILKHVWRGAVAPEQFESHHLYFGAISGDHALVSWMQAPHSYTGDDVVEISAHGSPAILKGLLAACLAAGARLALPGEFTRRAFLHGKLDLAQAEAVADLIAATSEQAARYAHDQLAGRLSHEVTALHAQLVELRAFVEAAIDFPEEDIAMIEREEVGAKLQSIRGALGKLAATYTRGRLIRDGVRVAIVGRPNVGKSSLLNRLAGCERAIVHAAPGTTRDVIEVTIAISGQVFHLADTAGIREGEHDVEKMGIARTRAAMIRADLLIVVLDGSCPLTADDEALLAESCSRPSIVCVNKCDLFKTSIAGRVTPGDAPRGPRESGETDEPWRQDPPQMSFEKSMSMSALTGEGIEELFATLEKMAAPSLEAEGGGATVTNLRHKEALDEAATELACAQEVIARRDATECIAHHLARAQESLGRITGAVTNEDLLDRIFSQFCIGK